MCPKDEIISAFLDGEIETPWQEKLNQHFARCTKCARRLAEMQQVSALLQTDKEPDYKAAMQRINRRIFFHTNTENQKNTRYAENDAPFWRRKVPIPMPAFVLLSAVLFMLFASFFFFIGQNNTYMAKREPEPYTAQPAQITIPINQAFEAKDLEVLLKLLENKDFSQEVLMELPEDSQFTFFGEPEIERPKK